MLTEEGHFAFPFAVEAASGRIRASGGDDAIRGKIIQVLFTAPGERVHWPSFGCGLFNLVFEANNSILASAMEFTVGQALTRWLSEEISVDAVDVRSEEENITIEIGYTKKADLTKKRVRIHFK